MQINFIESSPIPVKAAMAMMGLLEEVYRLPLVPPRQASRDASRRCCASRAATRGRPTRQGLGRSYAGFGHCR